VNDLKLIAARQQHGTNARLERYQRILNTRTSQVEFGRSQGSAGANR
jgi:hypothetical protein